MRASISFIWNLHSFGDENNWLNSVTIFYFIYTKRILDLNLRSKYSSQNTIVLVNSVCLFSNLGTINFEMKFSIVTWTQIPICWTLSYGMEAIAKTIILNFSVECLWGAWWQSFWSLSILWGLVVVWYWRILGAYFLLFSEVVKH